MKAVEKRKTPKYLLRILDSDLNDKKLVYNTEDGRQKFQVTVGVPQGSVFGTFLWNVTYGDFVETELPERGTLVGFTYDVVMGEIS